MRVVVVDGGGCCSETFGGSASAAEGLVVGERLGVWGEG